MLVAEERMALLALQAAVGEAMVTAALLPIQNEMPPKVSAMTQFHKDQRINIGEISVSLF